MPATAPLDQRARHQFREQAIWRTKMAGCVAFISASIGVMMVSMIGLDTGDWWAVAPYLLGAGLTFGFGAGVYFGRSQLAAAVLMVLAAATMVMRVVQTGTFSSLLVGVVLVYCYVQGFRGAVDLAELGSGGESA